MKAYADEQDHGVPRQNSLPWVSTAAPETSGFIFGAANLTFASSKHISRPNNPVPRIDTAAATDVPVSATHAPLSGLTSTSEPTPAPHRRKAITSVNIPLFKGKNLVLRPPGDKSKS